jgi:aminoglycoside 6'-N-acetyltransferase I
MTVRPVKLSDHEQWLSLRMALWPECPADQQLAEMLSYGDFGGSQIAFVAGVGRLSGFIEASLRQTAAGCATSPVGYIEGIFVKPDYRRRGVGRALVAAAEEWAASRGCTEMASDCLFDNSASELFHRKLGYCVTERLIHFRRSLVR